MRCVWCGFARLAGVAAVVAVTAACSPPTLAWASEASTWEAATSLASDPAPGGLRLVWHEGTEDPASTLDRLERAGFRVEIALPPHVFYVRESRRGARTLPAGYAYRGDATPSETAGRLAVATGDQEQDLFGGREDALPPLSLRAPSADAAWRSAARSTQAPGLPFGAKWKDTSEFMIGRVALGIFFPESDGSTDLNRYDWTPALRDSVVRSAVRALAHWTTFAARKGIPLSFALEIHPGLATRYEPIDRTSGEEDTWIADVLTGYLGFKSDAATLAYEAANGIRSRLGAQWSALLFAVQDDSSATGKFTDGAISHARIGGPFFVTPVKNGDAALQGASLDTYIEHELAHIFWALDEHFPSTGWWACSLTTGYLNIPNFNSVVPAPGYCGTPPAQCLMKGNYPDSLCVYTQGQIGWADRDQNGVVDLLETRPGVFPDSQTYQAVAGTPIVLRGLALELSLPNMNPYHFFVGDSISIATIDSVTYRMDLGPVSHAAALDGAYDGGRETFTTTLPPLAPGTYIVDWDTWNSNGKKSVNNPSTTISIRAPTAPAGAGGGQPAAGTTSLRFGPTPSRGPVRFTLRARPGGEGSWTIHDVRGRVVGRQRVTMPSTGIAEWTWAGRVAGGAALPSGLYFLSLEIDGATIQRRLVISH